MAWLTDERGRDQFVVCFGSETEVYWNDARQGKPDPVYHRSVSNIVLNLYSKSMEFKVSSCGACI